MDKDNSSSHSSPVVASSASDDATDRRIGAIAWLFFKLGTVAFGGPAAHLAMMEDEVVRRRRWMTSQEFLDLIAVTNLIPGPNSTEMAIHIGHRQAGWRGLVVAGTCFILPAFAIVLALSWLYVRYRSLPVTTGILLGVQPVVIAIIAQALWRLGRTACKSRMLAGLGVVAAGASLAGVHELLVLFGCAVFAGGVYLFRKRMQFGDGATLRSLAPFVLGAASGVPASAPAAGLGSLFWIFAKIGSVLYGSGYVLVAFLRSDFVERHGWLTEAQLLDAVAIGQVTPGPLFTTATFIGYVIAGPAGAVWSTLGIFLPAFIFVAISAPFVPRLRSSALAAEVLDGLTMGSVALMLAVTLQLAYASLTSPVSWALALGSLLVLLWFKLNATWLMAAGVVVGVLLFR
ncbi:MAG TPA: chromate efflux transporter [Phycisphaerae bacterium]|nr:chromate efflux transporter [Phycisphaerae bacterium]HOJ74126.1 chromate efflux transporter [Phycisphaerae bacterium]HOM50720.1 chromate efflux transporter [Phycisphaerae bacterium]HPP26096.1 chromate efflux transporter [Phycisphaerae bacterium]HPU26534.1 chromate efflux transporter [Phycisphaerae bacterium]